MGISRSKGEDEQEEAKLLDALVHLRKLLLHTISEVSITVAVGLLREIDNTIMITVTPCLSWRGQIYHHFLSQLVPGGILVVFNIAVEKKFHFAFMTDPYCF
jgi:hypothetical protein